MNEPCSKCCHGAFIPMDSSSCFFSKGMMSLAMNRRHRKAAVNAHNNGSEIYGMKLKGEEETIF